MFLFVSGLSFSEKWRSAFIRTTSGILGQSKMASTSPCCPPDAWGACSAPSEYVNKGVRTQLGPKLSAFVSKPADNSSPTKAIVVIPDIFGIDSGRTRAICDDFAQRLGCVVVLPLFLETLGGAWPSEWGMPNQPWYNLLWFIPWLIRMNLNKTGPLVDSELMPYLKSQGISEFAVTSFCWGATVGAYLSTLPECRGQISFHPSYNALGPSFGPSQSQLLSKITCKQLYLPGANDQAYPGCEAQKIIQNVAKQECEVIVFDKQVHGWVNRGDVTKPAVVGDVERALKLAEDFLKQVLQIQ
ncbi:hypothetical protein BASA81_001907 [Batrachochytrium salamandrivorans]|nr:hypothetical protein BASA81_001907 [Batrachochytrium salamandrivorans]